MLWLILAIVLLFILFGEFQITIGGDSNAVYYDDYGYDDFDSLDLDIEDDEYDLDDSEDDDTDLEDE